MTRVLSPPNFVIFGFKTESQQNYPFRLFALTEQFELNKFDCEAEVKGQTCGKLEITGIKHCCEKSLTVAELWETEERGSLAKGNPQIKKHFEN